MPNGKSWTRRFADALVRQMLNKPVEHEERLDCDDVTGEYKPRMRFFTRSDVECAGQWTKCAVGEQAPKLGAIFEDLGVNGESAIFDLGCKFDTLVNEDRVKDAITCYAQIGKLIAKEAKK